MVGLTGESSAINEPRIIIETPYDDLSLRQLAEEDSARIFQLVSYDFSHLQQFGGNTGKKYSSIEAIRDSIVSPDPSLPEELRFGIWNSDTMVGLIGFSWLNGQNVEVGYWIGKQHIGSRYASRSLSMLVNHAFINLGVLQFEAHIAVDNEASRKTAEKGGFVLSEIKKLEDPSGFIRDYWIFVRPKE